MGTKLALTVTLGCLLGLFSLTATSHTRLVESQPENGQVLNEAPGYILLKFSTPIEQKLGQLQLTSDDGKSWRILKTKTTDRNVTADIPTLKPAKYPAIYKVRWRVLSRDGHMQRGQFSFQLH